MSGPGPRIVPLGEAGLTVVLGHVVNRALHQRVMALVRRIEAANPAGVIEVVPAYAAVTVLFDPLVTSGRLLRARLAPLVDDEPEASSPVPRSPSPHSSPAQQSLATPLVTIPVIYDGEDIPAVARATGLSRESVVRMHSEREYFVYLLGFVPGFAYLGDLHPALVIPRRPTPRTRVPAGSVAIAGAQTGVYPLATPGGWHLIGKTELRLFDPDRNPPALLAPGTRVRFEAVP